jgi:hypothetical protein
LAKASTEAISICAQVLNAERKKKQVKQTDLFIFIMA